LSALWGLLTGVCSAALSGAPGAQSPQLLELATAAMWSVLRRSAEAAAVRRAAAGRCDPADRVFCNAVSSAVLRLWHMRAQAVSAAHVDGMAALLRHASAEVRCSAAGMLGAVGRRAKAPDANAVRRRAHRRRFGVRC
jgi:hypothetical protein